MLSLKDFEKRGLIGMGFSEEEIKKAEAVINGYIHRSYPYWVKGYLIVEKIFREELGVTSDVIEEISQKKDDPKCLTFNYLLHTRTALALGLFREAIMLSRTTLEVALKDKISEKYARLNSNGNEQKFRELYFEKQRELSKRKITFGTLIEMAEGKKLRVLPKYTLCKEFCHIGDIAILNKFIHGDITWLARFIEEQLTQSNINLMMKTSEWCKEKEIVEFAEYFTSLPFEIFKATCRILKKLYFEEDVD